MRTLRVLVLVHVASGVVVGQEPASWEPDLEFSTFSIAAIDPTTGESGVAVTTRVACVGNGVPWVRAGVGAVATQAFTRTAYGNELLDMMSQGTPASDALHRAVSADTLAARRQVGVIGLGKGSAQHTGSRTNPWAGHRAGPNYVTQGNLLVGPEVLAAVAGSFEGSAASGRHLADRLIAALAAGQAAGGDARKGRVQSAAVIVADPREGRSRRADGVTAHINVCEHPQPIAELRRIYNTVSQTLGYRELEQFQGRDVWQLKLMLHALGYYRPGMDSLAVDDDAFVYTAEAVSAVDAFREAQGLSTPQIGTPPGYVDADLVARLWTVLEAAGEATRVWERVKDLTAVRR